MPNSIGPDGLTTATYAELLEQFTEDFQAIYGADINIASDTPDGQMINIFIQATLDLEDLLTQIYTSFDPDQAIGVTLDQRVALNGIQRQAGTYTITNVSITTTQAVSLPGLDQDIVEPFTVADNAGNEFVLIVTENVPSAGTAAYAFRAKVPGAVLTVPNTITTPITIVLGVSAINNPTTYTTLGLNEETDAELKVRRQKSIGIASQGYYEALLAALENIEGVTSAFVYENESDITDGDGVPSHSIWVIVAGGDPQAIATAIYQKRNAGCGMFGDEVYVITRVNGIPFSVRWDYVEAEPLFIKFNASSLNGVDAPNTAAILAQLPGLLAPGVFEQVNINDLATIVQQIDPNTLVTGAGFSLSAMGVYTNTLTPSSKKQQFTVTSGDIDITVV